MNPIGRDPSSAEFFDAAAQGVLMSRYCLNCSTWSEPAALSCAQCQQSHLVWKATSGAGQIASWVIIPASKKAPAGTLSTVVAVVELDEGPWVTMSVADSAIPTFGQSVSIAFETPPEGEAIPVAILRK